jgi:hypothetical protein
VFKYVLKQLTETAVGAARHLAAWVAAIVFFVLARSGTACFRHSGSRRSARRRSRWPSKQPARRFRSSSASSPSSSCATRSPG